jgi:hypothetical protein
MLTIIYKSLSSKFLKRESIRANGESGKSTGNAPFSRKLRDLLDPWPSAASAVWITAEAQG